jgi:hypothetical protein
MAPNTHECLCEPVIMATGLEFFLVHTFLTRESKKKKDSSIDTTVNPLGKLSSVFCALF